jgi:hypothetical protein
MAKYLVLIWGDKATWEAAPQGWRDENTKGHEAFNAAAGAAVIGGAELYAPPKSVSIRTRSAEGQLISDGPYAETKEVIGGYYLLEAADLDEATRLAALIPEASAPTSGVEIRPIKESG